MIIEHQADHDDGSATYTINLSDEEQIALVQEGLISILRKEIDKIQTYQNDIN